MTININVCIISLVPKNADVAHLVERHLAKVEVASSSLLIRSKKFEVARLGIFLSIAKQWHIISRQAVYHHA